MAEFVKGDVVVVPFLFSDLTLAKRRPALVIADLEGDDVIHCQMTSKTVRDKYSLPLDDGDFETGSLKQPSNIRPNRIFTADSCISPYRPYRTGHLKNVKLSEVVDKTVQII